MTIETCPSQSHIKFPASAVATSFSVFVVIICSAGVSILKFKLKYENKPIAIESFRL